jgi:hypothetical protein
VAKKEYAEAEAVMHEALRLKPAIKGAAAFISLLQEKQLAEEARRSAGAWGKGEGGDTLVLAGKGGGGVTGGVGWGVGGAGEDMGAVTSWFEVASCFFTFHTLPNLGTDHSI